MTFIEWQLRMILLEEKWLFKSTYSVKILKERLRATLDQKAFFLWSSPKFFRRKQFIGRIDGDYVFVKSRPNIVLWILILGSSGFYYHGKLMDCSDGAFLEGTYRMNWIGRIFMFVLFNLIFIAFSGFVLFSFVAIYKFLVFGPNVETVMMVITMGGGAVMFFIAGCIVIGLAKLIDSQNKKSVHRFLEVIINE